ncbi:hypothetical protein [Haliangium sp.]|uniref:hypothetical protein n=1 Tax=Haliangium sp. TaxID=2663208 RepID=UPI003D0D74CB
MFFFGHIARSNADTQQGSWRHAAELMTGRPCAAEQALQPAQGSAYLPENKELSVPAISDRPTREASTS